MSSWMIYYMDCLGSFWCCIGQFVLVCSAFCAVLPGSLCCCVGYRLLPITENLVIKFYAFGAIFFVFKEKISRLCRIDFLPGCGSLIIICFIKFHLSGSDSQDIFLFLFGIFLFLNIKLIQILLHL